MHRLCLHCYRKKEPDTTGGLVYPGGETAFKAILSARFCAAIWSHITDCDETFNYWEPMHFLGNEHNLQIDCITIVEQLITYCGTILYFILFL